MRAKPCVGKRGGHGPTILRLVVGNTLIMKEPADAASYAPITILVDERADVEHLSYDSTSSLLGDWLLGPENNPQPQQRSSVLLR